VVAGLFLGSPDAMGIRVARELGSADRCQVPRDPTRPYF
jgi:hypothetical protein